jgi:hypothetical protein
MKEVDKLASEIITHNAQIGALIAQIEQRFPGRTLADLLVEAVFG